MNTSLKLKILIVEDDLTSELLLEEELEDYCKEILHAADGNEAIEIARNNPDIDLILMDIKLPNMNGFEATRRIRVFNPKVVIIAETAYAFPEDKVLALKAGCNDYISKPILKEKLLNILNNYFAIKN